MNSSAGVLINGALPHIRDNVSLCMILYIGTTYCYIFVGGSKRKGRASKKESPCSDRSSQSNCVLRVKETLRCNTPSPRVPAPALVVYSPVSSDSSTFTRHLACRSQNDQFPATSVSFSLSSSRSPSFPFFLSFSRTNARTHDHSLSHTHTSSPCLSHSTRTFHTNLHS